MRPPTHERRFMEYRRVLLGSNGLEGDALVLALDYQARFVTAIRELCERRKVQPPYGGPPTAT